MDLFPPTSFLPGFQGKLFPNSLATILSGQQDSSTIIGGGGTLCGVFIPAGFTGSSISFLASQDGSNFFPVHNTTSGALLSYSVTAGTYCAIDPKDFYGINFLQIVSASSEGATRTLYVALKGF
jgi:hypothetical protein